MANTSFVRKPPFRPLSKIEEGVAGVFFGFVFFFISLVVFSAGMQVWYLGRNIPGTALAGESVDGLTPAETANKISARFGYVNTGHLLIYDQVTQKNWKLSPAQLGILLDPDASAQAVLRVGRTPNPLQSLQEQLSTWLTGQDVPPVLVFDQRLGYTLLLQIAKEIDQPMINAGISINGTEVNLTQAQSGRKVNIQATLELIRFKTTSLQDAAVPLVIEETPPSVLDASQAAKQVQTLLSQPLTLTLPDGQKDREGTSSWQIEPDTLAHMVSVETVSENGKALLKVSLSRQALLAYLGPLAPKLQAQKENARFTFNDQTQKLEVLQAAVLGRSLDLQKSAVAISDNALNGEHNIPLALNLEKPDITDDKTGVDLGIRELIHEEVSYFYGSPNERVQNIIAASGRFHGLLVAPGQIVSMADVMGDVSLDTGYAEALIISGGQTIKGVGGGVCQVSTTLFRAAFMSGYPIVERHPHAYRVGYYEYDPNGRRSPQYAGLDATVYVPVVDFKFKNDSDTWLLMETYVNPSYSTLIWKFYGTKDGRSVDWETSGPTNVVDHPKSLYRENKDLPAGEVKQVDYAADGADVNVHRIVRRNGQVITEDTFATTYQPWQAVYEYGPGTENMPPAEEPTQ